MSTILGRTPIRFLCTCVIGLAVTLVACQPAYANVSYVITLSDGSISPSAMSARMNETVSIRVVNRGTKPHNLVIKDFFVFTQDLSPGQDVQVSFNPDKTGSFPYHSDTGGRPEAGMQGTLTVS